MGKKKSKFDANTFLLRIELRNQFNWQHLLGVKIPNLHCCISAYQFEYFNWCEIFVIASFIVQLELLFELCLSGGFTIACMSDFLLIFTLVINHLKHQFDQSLSTIQLVILLRIQPIRLDWSPSLLGSFAVLRVVMSPK
jgi:hypothetical protein